MRIISNFVSAAAILAMTAGIGLAQTNADARQRAQKSAEEVRALLVDLEAQAAGFPEVLTALSEGRANIEQADETVLRLIDQLKTVTSAMEDESQFDDAIDDYKKATVDLIAEGEASDNQIIKDLVPSLQETLAGLEEDDKQRARTVIEARNTIAQLEENREAIVFIIRAGEVTRGAELISTEVTGYTELVDRAKGIADSLIERANP